MKSFNLHLDVSASSCVARVWRIQHDRRRRDIGRSRQASSDAKQCAEQQTAEGVGGVQRPHADRRVSGRQHGAQVHVWCERVEALGATEERRTGGAREAVQDGYTAVYGRRAQLLSVSVREGSEERGRGGVLARYCLQHVSRWVPILSTTCV